jgi:hypothetical protein
MTTTTITFKGTPEQIDLLLYKNGYTGIELLFDEDGKPVYENIEYYTNEDGSFMLDENGQKVIKNLGEQSTRPVSKADYLTYLIKHQCIMPLVKRTTVSLELEYGSLNYNAEQMTQDMLNLITVESIEE